MKKTESSRSNVFTLFGYATLFSMVFSCASTGKMGAGDTASENAVGKTIEDLSEEERDLTIEEALPVKDTLETGVCFDSVHAKFLIDSYKSENSKKNLKKKRSKALALRQDHEAYYYARTMLRPSYDTVASSIPIVENDRVEFWVEYFKGRGRETFLKWLHRADEIRDLVIPVLREERVPEELFFLAMIESGFNNTVASRAKATGTWQFMAPTARIFGLRIDHWVDERRDPVKSTRAAARYLRDLYGQFGDWYLAMAAYNAGPGKIRSAVRRSKTNDFWKISETNTIRSETKHYVPKVLAAIKLAHSEARTAGFSLSLAKPSPAPLMTVTLADPVDLQELADTSAISQEMLAKWNPELLQGISPPLRIEQGPYELRVSQNVKADIEAALPHLSKLEITDIKLHIIRAGDTLLKLSKKYKVSLQQIRQFNPDFKSSLLKVGRSIAIPIPGVVRRKSDSNEQASDVPEFG